jgi:Tfp pilus assembly protein PilP
MKLLAAALLMAVLAGVRTHAAEQPPTPPPAAPAPAAPTTAKPANPADAPPAPPQNYAYSAEGRRDPFVSLINRGTTGQKGAPQSLRAEGVNGILVEEVVVKGIVQTRGAWVAMVAGIDGKVYSVRAGDKLADGVVREVNAQSVVILQEVNDPLSLAKQREVRKLLRGGEEVK